jgi:hypothetical protein
MAMATDDSERRGTKWGAILHQHQATLSPLKRSLYLCDLAFSCSQQQPRISPLRRPVSPLLMAFSQRGTSFGGSNTGRQRTDCQT